MKISTRGKYGTRALLELALHWGRAPMTLKDIAASQEIPLHYLEHLIGPLVSAGIVRSNRGARGGIQLARPPREIKLSQVIQLLENSTSLVECINNPQSCPRHQRCATRDVWIEMKNAMDHVLDSTTLQDLADRQKKKDESQMYFI